MKNKIFFILIILISNFCYSQKSLNEQFKKIIIERIKTENSNDISIKDHELWSEYFKTFKKDEIISFYTTSNLPFCDLKKINIVSDNKLTIGRDNMCSEPPAISIFDKNYEYKIKKDLLKIFNQGKIYCLLKIINIEDYQQEKFGKESYKLTFLVIK